VANAASDLEIDIAFTTASMNKLGVTKMGNVQRFFIAAGCALVVIGCGQEETPEQKASETQTPRSSTMITLPATVEGTFSISVEKGDVDDQGVSEVNFGTLAVNGVEHLVQVSGKVLSAARIPRDGGRVRATLSSRTDQYGAPTYIITEMEKL
jgi:hypothetical protein